MGWVGGSVVDQRLAFVLVVRSGVSVSEACRRFGISRPTGYKWLRRFAAEGIEGLGDRSRRPERSPRRVDAEIEELVVQARRAFPEWGGRKLHGLLVQQGHVRVPAPATITRILVRRGLIEPAVLPQRSFRSFVAAAPNELWQMDFKGPCELSSGQTCHPFGVLDDHSRFNLTLTVCGDYRTSTVQDRLNTAFQTYGLPVVILADNGPPWGTSNPDFRWTPLRVWLADLGIRVVYARPKHPQTLGKQERFHRTLATEVLRPGRPWHTPAQLQAAFDHWRIIYNHHRPHDALDGHVPADRYRPSLRPYPEQIEPPAYPDTWFVRTVDAAARITIAKHRHKIGKPFIGRRVGINPDTNIAYYRTYPIRVVNHVPEQV